jgi:hypothetical protein
MSGLGVTLKPQRHNVSYFSRPHSVRRTKCRSIERIYHPQDVSKTLPPFGASPGITLLALSWVIATLALLKKLAPVEESRRSHTSRQEARQGDNDEHGVSLHGQPRCLWPRLQLKRRRPKPTPCAFR